MQTRIQTYMLIQIYSKHTINLGLPYSGVGGVDAYGNRTPSVDAHGVGAYSAGTPNTGAPRVGAPGVGAFDAGAHVVDAHNFGAGCKTPLNHTKTLIY